MERFDDIFRRGVGALRGHGFDPYPERVTVRVQNAREQLAAGLRYYLGERAKWLPCYDEVAQWLTDNQGRGLLCTGLCGLGKTLMCQNILPVIIRQNMKKIVITYTAQEMNDNIATVKRCHLVVIDDIGTEPAVKLDYGERKAPFFELCDEAEKRGHLLILTTNLRTTHAIGKGGMPIPSIEDRYGDRVLSRLRGLVKVVEFKGKDMRQQSVAAASEHKQSLTTNK